MGTPKLIFFHNYPTLTPDNFLRNIPSQFIFTNLIARVEFCQKNITQPSPTFPSPWVAPNNWPFFTYTQLWPLPTFYQTHLASSYSPTTLARVEFCQKNITQPSPTFPSLWVAPKKIWPFSHLPNFDPCQLFTQHNLPVHIHQPHIQGWVLSEKYHTTFFNLPLPMGSPPNKFDLFHNYPTLTPANFLPNTPSQFIFTNHIARVELCQKNITQPCPTFPSPWVAPQKNLFFLHNYPTLTPANFLPNTPCQFIFTNLIDRVEFCQKNITQLSPTSPPHG